LFLVTLLNRKRLTGIWNIKEKLINQYGTKLDIVYDDAQFPLPDKGYEYIYFWNQTV
jgi:hypothetical protein